MLRGYADAHVVFALVQALRQRGMNIVRVQDRGREHADDVDLLDEALADERVMLTNDADFLVLVAERGTRHWFRLMSSPHERFCWTI
jgi:predicted nuclease of predicted toxin-antitoxin system